MNKADSQRFIDAGRKVLQTETNAVQELLPRVDREFAHACSILLNCRGRIVVTGIGKSGHIANKIAATLASTGTPSFFVHPGEASHGDMGMITAHDVLLAVSNSGETKEIVILLPLIKRLGVPLVSLTGKRTSTIAATADVNLDVSVSKEACPLNLAPTASTTATLAMGDALAVALLDYRGFTEEDFARSHPGGTLGRRLLLRVSDIMHEGSAAPRVDAETTLLEGLVEMTDKALGMTTVVDDDLKLLGVFTDGDLRRALDKGVDPRDTVIGDLMSTNCKTVQPETLAAEAVHIMETHKIIALPVVDNEDRLVGALNIHDLFRSGVM